MENMKGNIEIINHEPDNLLLGDNEFASETLTLQNNEVVKDGYVLVRHTDGKLKIATDVDGQAFIAVTRDDIENKTGGAKDYYLRVCVAGKVKKSLVSVKGVPLTAAQADSLRQSGILALDVKSIGVKDNQ